MPDRLKQTVGPSDREQNGVVIEQSPDAAEATPLETGELPPIERDPSRPVTRPRFRPIGLTLKVVAFAGVIYFLVLPLIPGFRSAATEITKVEPAFLVGGLALQIAALFSYSLLTRSALGEAGNQISRMRMFRIQMSTKALGNIVPGGSAASSALGYRLMTLSGVSGPDAGFALATAGLGSAVVLNLIFWIALLVSIPLRGVNPLYVTAALAGLVIMVVVALLVFGLLHGQGRAERFLRWLGAQAAVRPGHAANALRHVGERLEELIADRSLLAPGAAVGQPQLAARRGVAVGVPPRVRRHARHRRPARGLRPGQHRRRHPDHAGRARHRRGHLHPDAGRLRRPTGGRPRSAWPHIASPSSGSRSCSAACCTPRCASGRGRSSAATGSTACATSPGGRRPRASGASSSPCASGSASGPASRRPTTPRTCCAVLGEVDHGCPRSARRAADDAEHDRVPRVAPRHDRVRRAAAAPQRPAARPSSLGARGPSGHGPAPMTAMSGRSGVTSRTSSSATSTATGRARRSPSTTTTCSA